MIFATTACVSHLVIELTADLDLLEFQPEPEKPDERGPALVLFYNTKLDWTLLDRTSYSANTWPD